MSRWPPSTPGSAVGLIAAVALLTLAVAASFGALNAWPSPDTPSFVASVGLGNARLPLYGWLLRLVPHQGAMLPMIQWGAFILASCALATAIRRFGASWAAAVAVGLALVWSNLLLLWGNALLPEVFAHAALLLALAMMLELTKSSPRGACVVAGIALVSAGVTLAWALRSSLLPFAVLVPLIPLLLAPGRRRLALMLAAACLAPVLILSAIRLARVGDFNVVSFGGFQMSGMATLMLTPDIADRLPPADAALARAVLARRTALEAAGTVIAIPPNSSGRRSFVSAAIFYFDILARTHDAALYGSVPSQQRPGESWPAFNNRLQRFALATIRAAPVPYAAWVLGAASRLVGHALVLNPAFVLASGVLLILALLGREARQGQPPDWRVLLVLVGAYTAGSGALTVLITFPASRYVDSTALLLAALPFYAVLRRI